MVKEIVVISGKGGTGKTSMVASLSALAGKSVLADCDVDVADLHLVLQPQVKKTEDFNGGKRASILPAKCSGCGKCREVCRFEAIYQEAGRSLFAIDPIACEGCGVCSYFCPEKAILFEPAVNGQWFVSDTRYGPMVHAKLGIAEENSGKLVSLVRSQAKKIGEQENLPFIIVDGPPGIGCPVIASVTGADAVLIVTEPTVAGEHDMGRVAELARHFGVPAYLCVNKYDINPQMSKKIEAAAEKEGIRTVGRVCYDRAVTDAQVKGVAVVELNEKAAVSRNIIQLWENIAGEISPRQA